MAFMIENGILKSFTPETPETEIIIPDGVVEIGDGAFDSLSRASVYRITMPHTLKKSGSTIFREMFHLTASIQVIS